MLKHNLKIDLNLVEQLKEVRQYWNQDTAIAAKKRREFIHNVKAVGGTVLAIYLIGYLQGHSKGFTQGSNKIFINVEGRQ